MESWENQPDNSLTGSKRRSSKLERLSSPSVQPGYSPWILPSTKHADPKLLKRALQDGVDHDESFAHYTKRRRRSFSETTWTDRWIAKECPEISAEQAVKAIATLLTIEKTEDDQWSQQDKASKESERLNSSSPLFRGVLKANGLCVDEMGDHIPPEVQELVDRHIRKARDSPRLSEEEIKAVRRIISKSWHNAEPALSGIFTAPLFPIPPNLSLGGGTTWNSQALPRNPSYRYSICPPKTDLHFGFPTTLISTWDISELDVADHPFIRPYSQPTGGNMFPSYLRETRSEATGGTLYVAEGQLASAGAHRVNSWLWILDQLDPNRKRSSSDAVVFSDAGTQREAVAYVHYFNPEDGMFYMSCIDQFYYRNDIQRYRDHLESVMDWLVNTQQPMIRHALRQLRPIVKTWGTSRITSVATTCPDPNPSNMCLYTGSQRSGNMCPGSGCKACYLA